MEVVANTMVVHNKLTQCYVSIYISIKLGRGLHTVAIQKQLRSNFISYKMHSYILSANHLSLENKSMNILESNRLN